MISIHASVWFQFYVANVSAMLVDRYWFRPSSGDKQKQLCKQKQHFKFAKPTWTPQEKFKTMNQGEKNDTGVILTFPLEKGVISILSWKRDFSLLLALISDHTAWSIPGLKSKVIRSMPAFMFCVEKRSMTCTACLQHDKLEYSRSRTMQIFQGLGAKSRHLEMRMNSPPTQEDLQSSQENNRPFTLVKKKMQP